MAIFSRRPRPAAAAEAEPADQMAPEPATPLPRQFIIHAGVHKTGTSAIQYHFWTNAHRLDRYGILYPVAGRPHSGAAHPYGHHDIPWSLRGTIRGDPDALLARLRDEIAASPARQVLVSSEEFDRIPEAAIERIARAIDLPTRVVFYYRRQSAILESIYGTDVINAGERRTLSLYASTYDGALDFLAFARKWAAVFGREAITARAYDTARFPDGNIVPDFLDAAALPGPPPIPGEPFVYNRSLPWYGVQTILKMRRALVPEPVIERTAQALEIVFRDTPWRGGLMSPAEARAFDLSFADRNAAFHAEFCPNEPPIEPHSGDGEDQFELDHAGLWPDFARTISAAADHILRYPPPRADE